MYIQCNAKHRPSSVGNDRNGSVVSAVVALSASPGWAEERCYVYININIFNMHIYTYMNIQ